MNRIVCSIRNCRRSMAEQPAVLETSIGAELVAMSNGSEEELVGSQGQSSYHALGSEDSLRVRIRSGSGKSDRSTSPDIEGFINITGLDDTAQALDQCEKWVLRPYRYVLKALGWTSFTRDGDGMHLKIARGCLVTFWVVVIITACLTQFFSCFRRDMFIPGMMRNGSDTTTIMCRQHVISSFVLSDILLVVTYLFGLYLFSRGETEYLSNLADKVFIKMTLAQRGSKNWWLIGTILTFFGVGLLWIILSFVVRIMTAVANRLFQEDVAVELTDDGALIEGPTKVVLLVISMIGFFFFDMIYVSAVMNYAAQSEMNIYLLNAIKTLVENKEYPELDGAIKDIVECRKYLRVLNGKTATLTALILFNLGSLGLVALITLDRVSTLDLQKEALATVTAAFNVILWLGLVIFPFVQAARVTDACEKLKATGPLIRARPLQYVHTPQLELDSYIILIRAVKMRATMFGIPIYPWMTYAALVLTTFTFLVLFILGTYNFTYYL